MSRLTVDYGIILKGLQRGIIKIDSLREKEYDAKADAANIITGQCTDTDAIGDFLKVMLDYYTYSPRGEVLISDSLYDECMVKYEALGGKPFFTASPSTSNKWKLVEHKVPGMVGTLGKIYSEEELRGYFNRYREGIMYTMAPKFDGVSCCVEVVNGNIHNAVTRYDGIKGQCITPLVNRARNADNIFDSSKNGLYKCELCMSMDSFNRLREEREYMNRRSAISAIVSTPNNIDLGKYIDIIPLVYYDYSDSCVMDYIAPYSREIYGDIEYAKHDIRLALETFKNSSFPYRVDGVVLYPVTKMGNIIDETDILCEAIAYKANSAESVSSIEYAYYSVGRTGKAMPMVHVKPVEVNETIVTDVSVGSRGKFLDLELREGEDVVVYSAGDVIPQIQLTSYRDNYRHKPLLKIDPYCPYCHIAFTLLGTEFVCTNQSCVRVVSGRVSNFFIKLGIEGFSDKSFENIYLHHRYKLISDYLQLTIECIMAVDGFEEVSSNKLLGEIMRIRSTPLPISTVFGSLGISNISEKKCRRIFECITLDELLQADSHKLESLYWELRGADGIGPKTAYTFIDYIKHNIDEICKIISLLVLKPDITYIGNVVFTGFRDEELEERFNSLGFEVSSSVTGNTVAVLAANVNSSSTKLKRANQRGLRIYSYENAESLLTDLREDYLGLN